MTTTTEFAAAEETSSTDNKKKVISAGILGALVLGYGGYTMLHGGNAASDESFTPIKHTPIVRTKVAPAVKKAPAQKQAVVPAASTVKLGRDPFLALYTVPVAAAPAAPAGTTPAATTPDTTSTGTTSTGTTTSTTGGSTAPAAPSSTPYALKLMSIKGTDARLYTFSVAGTTKTVLAAQKFGKYAELVVLAYVKDAKGNPIGALLQVGDADPVGVKVGEKITVK